MVVHVVTFADDLAYLCMCVCLSLSVAVYLPRCWSFHSSFSRALSLGFSLCLSRLF